MTATSVTGRGLGSADKKNKGSEHMTLGAEKLIGPRVVAADSVTLDGSGDASIKLPVLTGAAADYVVMALDADTTAAAAVAATLAMDTTATTVTFKGPASGVLYYSIIKKGLAI
jgi:hypothetical protein